jgi:uncharacterized protein (DUF362 family)/NAD-dependent dihydropyrimidine dehydrogenase PreA subunit
MSTVIIIDSDYESLYEKIKPVLCNILHVPEIKSILLKPNLLSGAVPEKAVCTHPEFVRVIKRILEECGKRVIASDNPGVSGYGSSIKAARDAGYLDFLGDLFENPAKSPERVRIKLIYTDSFVVSGYILHAEYVINLPKFKTHSLTLFSGAIKNMFGILIGGEKARAHSIGKSRDEFAELLVDIYNIRKPELTIMDAIWGMEGSGPSNGSLRKINKVIISEDGFAVDAVCAKMIGIEPYEIPYLRVAQSRGLIDFERIEIVGELQRLDKFKLPPTFSGVRVAGKSFIGFVNSFVFDHFIKGPARLKLLREKCTKCYVCLRQCPAKAIDKDAKGFPQIDKKKCIGCYCCDELCPENAWKISGIMRLIGRR